MTDKVPSADAQRAPINSTFRTQMPPFRTLLARPTIFAFWAWFAICLFSLFVSLLDGSMHREMLEAVDYASSEGPYFVENRDHTATSFIYISLVYFAVTSALGALLVHRATAGRKWAFILLVPLALWLSYESFSSPFALGAMYPGSIGASDWAFAALGGVVWLFILFHTALARRRAAI